MTTPEFEKEVQNLCRTTSFIIIRNLVCRKTTFNMHFVHDVQDNLYETLFISSEFFPEGERGSPLFFILFLLNQVSIPICCYSQIKASLILQEVMLVWVIAAYYQEVTQKWRKGWSQKAVSILRSLIEICYNPLKDMYNF